MLNEGNQEVQKNIFNYFKNFTSSEVFFQRIHRTFSDEISRLKQEQADGIKVAVREDVILNIENILRLLQLFAEGHYSEL